MVITAYVTQGDILHWLRHPPLQNTSLQYTQVGMSPSDSLTHQFKESNLVLRFWRPFGYLSPTDKTEE